MTLILIGLGLVVLAETPTFRRYSARVARSASDEGSATVITTAGVFGAALAFATAALVPADSLRLVPESLRVAGLVVTGAGAALRFWSISMLGQYFSLTLQTQAFQRIVASGPYAFLRHPSYLAGEMAMLGLGLLCGNWLSVLLLTVPLVAAHVHRIQIEERMMHRAFGDAWLDYVAKTSRLVPGVF